MSNISTKPTLTSHVLRTCVIRIDTWNNPDSFRGSNVVIFISEWALNLPEALLVDQTVIIQEVPITTGFHQGEAVEGEVVQETSKCKFII